MRVLLETMTRIFVEMARQQNIDTRAMKKEAGHDGKKRRKEFLAGIVCVCVYALPMA